jgi:hypothetical protein
MRPGHSITPRPRRPGDQIGGISLRIDPTKPIAGVFMTQVVPFADQRALRAYRRFERRIYHGRNAA